VFFFVFISLAKGRYHDVFFGFEGRRRISDCDQPRYYDFGAHGGAMLFKNVRRGAPLRGHDLT